MTIRLCSETIRAIHRRQFELAESRLQKVRVNIEQIRHSSNLSGWGAALAALQEYVEAEILLAYVKNPNNSIPLQSDLKVSSVAYVLGLADVIGELRRYTLDHLR